MPRWFRVAVGAFALSAWMTVAVSAGVANADSPPPSDGQQTNSDTKPDGSSADKPDGPGATKPDGPGATKSDAPRRPGVSHQRLTRDRFAEARDRSEVRDRKPNRTKQDAADLPGAEPEDPSTEADADIATPPPPETEPSVEPKPRLLLAPRARHGEDRLELAGPAVNPVRALRPSAVGSKPLAPTDHTDARSAPTTRAIQAVDPKPSAARTAAAPTPAPGSSATTGAVDVPQLGRQATGLASDVGVVAVSVVYSVADTIAQAFGPHDFLGVPYAIATVLANTAAAAGRTLIGAPLDAASPGRFRVTYGVLDGLSFFNPQKPPPGANDPTITVTAQHPLPIILVNGTTATQGTNWGVGAPVLANAGYKVYTFNYGNVTGYPDSPIQATGDISKSAEELDKEIDRVLSETGADKVILIGHSQGGGILPAYYINNVDGGAEKVSQVIGIAPSNHGTDFNGLVGLLRVPVLGQVAVAALNLIGPAFVQQMVGSDFQEVVYGEQDTDPRVIYTNIITMNDEIVTPYTQQALEGDNVTNIILQERYPGYPAGHLGVVLSPQVWSIVLEELEKNSEANPSLQSEVLAA